MIITAGIFIFDNNDKLFVAHPTGHDPNFWSITKGKVEPGETEFQAAVRETLEESNIDLLKYRYKLFELDYVTYRSKKKKLKPFIALLKEPIVDEFKCTSMVSHLRNPFPEMDDFKLEPLDNIFNKLHESQQRALLNAKASKFGSKRLNRILSNLNTKSNVK